jgi:hypothetical protein
VQGLPPYGPPPGPPGPQVPPGGFAPPPVGSYGYPPPVQPQPSGEAIAALVCGIMAFSCFPLGFVALWLGARARRAAREQPGRVGGEQLALAGMIAGGVIGTLGTLAVLAYVGFIVFVIGFAATTAP